MLAGKIPDIELGEYKRGYPALSRYAVEDVDDEPLVCRKFRFLGAQNLFHLQGELFELEDKLKDSINDAYKSKETDEWRSIYEHEIFAQRAARPNSKEAERMRLVTDIRAKLKEYYETVQLQKDISRISRPDTRVLSVLRAWMTADGDVRKKIGGKAAKFLDYEYDLAALHVPTDRDPLTSMLKRYWRKPKMTRPYDLTDPTAHMHESTITRTVFIIDMVVAALLLIGPIIGLHFVTSDHAQLGMVGGFTALFVASMSLLTNARRAETFTATAAYAAVLVIFISSNASGGSPSSTIGSPMSAMQSS